MNIFKKKNKTLKPKKNKGKPQTQPQPAPTKEEPKKEEEPKTVVKKKKIIVVKKKKVVNKTLKKQKRRTAQVVVGEGLWIPDASEDFSRLFKHYDVASVSADKQQVFLLDQYTKKIFQVDVNQTKTFAFDRCHTENFDELTRMNFLHEASLLHVLYERYIKDEIYTFFGDTLISINPYFNIQGLYSKKVKNEPHVFTMAQRAFDLLSKKRVSQSIVINGDSGAGKTEAAKQIMRHLVHISLKENEATTPEVENLVLESTPVLEAFGNSITLRNDNSSRFGRFIQILYDDKLNINGMTTLHFLLEKSRMITRSPGERNYHILYQVCAGMEQEASSFNYLQPCLSPQNYKGKIPDDFSNFERTKRSLLTIGIDSKIQESLFKILLGFLNLGNIDFIKDDKDEANIGKVNLLESSRTFLNQFNVFLDISVESQSQVEDCLLKRTLTVGNEKTIIPLNLIQARDSRDGLAKYLYSKVFDWIVSELNQKSKQEAQTQGKARFIGVLDIFGFEDLEKNSFEQLCVNYANELLQKQFDLHVVESERRLFKEEGVDFPNIQLPSLVASETVLHELKHVVFDGLEEQCMLRSGTDVAFTNNLVENKKNIKVELDWKKKLGFIVKHFAGEVSYDAEGILDKNRDSLNEDLKHILVNSNNPIIQQIIAQDGHIKNKAMAEKATVLKKFLTDMNDLISTLSATDNSFVRCIKPNSTQTSHEFDVRQIKSQLEYLGILQAIRVHQETYPVRREFNFIPEHYHSLIKDEDREKYDLLEVKEKIRMILKNNVGEDSEFKLWQLGYTRVFLGDEVLFKLDAIMNKRREEKLGKMSDEERMIALEKERLKQEEEIKRARQKMEDDQKEKLAEEKLILKKEEERIKKMLMEREEKMKREQQERDEILKKREEELLTQERNLSEKERNNVEKFKTKQEEIEKQREQEEAILSQQREKLQHLAEQEKLKQEEIEKLNLMQDERVQSLEEHRLELLKKEKEIEEKQKEQEKLLRQKEEEIKMMTEKQKKEYSLKVQQLQEKEEELFKKETEKQEIVAQKLKENKERSLREKENDLKYKQNENQFKTKEQEMQLKEIEKRKQLQLEALSKDKLYMLKEEELEIAHIAKQQQLKEERLQLLAYEQELEERERAIMSRAQQRYPRRDREREEFDRNPRREREREEYPRREREREEYERERNPRRMRRDDFSVQSRRRDEFSIQSREVEEVERKKAKQQRRRAKLYATILFQSVVRGFLIRRNYIDLRQRTKQYSMHMNTGELVVMSSVIINTHPVYKGSKRNKRMLLLTTDRRLMVVDPITLRIDQEAFFDPASCKIVSKSMTDMHLFVFTDRSRLEHVTWKFRDIFNDTSVWLAIFETLTFGGEYVKRGLYGVLGKRLSRKDITIAVKVGELKIINDESSLDRTSSRRSMFGRKGKKDPNRMHFYHLKIDKRHGLQWFDEESSETCVGQLSLDKTVRVLIPDTSNVHGKLSTFVFCLKVVKRKKDKLYTLQAGGVEDRKNWILSLRRPIVRDGFRRKKAPQQQKKQEEIKFLPTFLNPGESRKSSRALNTNRLRTDSFASRNSRQSLNSRQERPTSRNFDAYSVDSSFTSNARAAASKPQARTKPKLEAVRTNGGGRSNRTLTRGEMTRTKSQRRMGRALSFRDSAKKGAFDAEDFMSAFDDTDIQTNAHIKSFAKNN